MDYNLIVLVILFVLVLVQHARISYLERSVENLWKAHTDVLKLLKDLAQVVEITTNK